MRSLSLACAIVVAAVVSISPASAQATRTWVSGVGDDANPCSRTAPCKTFAGAISKTAPAGEINVLDPGGFGAVTITKSITISAEYVEAGVLVSGTNGIVVQAGTTDIVTLRGLDIEGLGTSLTGIKFNSGGALHIQNCTIRAFRTSPAFAIQIVPGNNATFTIDNTIITDNGSPGVGGGIQIKPTGSASVNGVISRVTFGSNASGIVLDGSGGTGGMNVTLVDSVVTGGSGTGILVASATTATTMMVNRSTIANNGTGITQTGAAATIRVGGSVITGNGTGVSGSVLSYVNNQLNGNASDGTMTPISPGPFH